MPDDFFANGSHAALADVRAILDSSVPALVAELVEMGVLVSIGATRDRGAVSITVTSDGRWRREYFRSSDDAADFLGHAVDAIRGAGVGPTVTQPPVIRKPTRGRQRAV